MRFMLAFNNYFEFDVSPNLISVLMGGRGKVKKKLLKNYSPSPYFGTNTFGFLNSHSVVNKNQGSV